MLEGGAGAGGRRRPARRGLWTALALMALGACVQALVVPRSALFFDDLTFFQVAREMGLGRDLLLRSANGHLMPGFHAANFAYWRLFGMAWWPAAVYLVVLWTVACGLMFAIARELSPSRRAAVLATVVFAVSPIPVASTTWWAAGISLITTLVASMVAIVAFLHWDRTRRPLLLVVIALSYAVALVFWEKALLISVEVVALALVLLDHGVGPRERWRRLLRRAPAWAALAVPAAVDLGFYLRGPYLEESGEPASLRDVVAFSWTAFSEALVPALAGLKPVDQTVLGSALPLVAVGWVVVGGAGVHLARTRVGTAPGWVFLGLAVALNLAVVGRGRAVAFVDAGLDFRYHLDTLLLVAVALAWIAGRPRRPGSRSTSPAGLGVAVVAYVLVCATTATTVLTHLGGPYFRRSDWTLQTRAFVDRFSQDYRRFGDSAPGLPVLDTMVPFPPAFTVYPYDRASRSLVLYEPTARFSRRDEPGLQVLEDGSLVRSRFRGAEVSARGPTCVTPGSAPRVLDLGDSTSLAARRAVAIHLERAPGASVVIALRTAGTATTYLTDAGGLPLDDPDPSLMVQLPTVRVETAEGRVVLPFDDLAVYGLTGTGCVRSARSGQVLPVG